MSKKALVINKLEMFKYLELEEVDNHYASDLDMKTPGQYVWVEAYDIFDLNTALLDRSDCETNERFLQVLPYVALRHNDIENGTIKYFVYQRGVGGNENRLHGNYSLGLGGHIEEAPHYDELFHECVIGCIRRELLEEVGLKTNYIDIYSTLRDYAMLFYDDTNPVGRVHLGVNVTLEVNPYELNEHEQGVITNGQWLTLEEIKQKMENKETPFELENWSKMYLEANTDFYQTK